MIIVWRVTERCNLSCPFCAYDRTQDRPRREADPEAIRSFGATLAEYQHLTGDPVLMSWLGGEPLLWPPLRELTEYLHHDLGLRVSATTNGTTLGSEEVRRHLLACYAELTVSVDAPGEAHDRLRGWPGAFAALRERVSALVAERRTTGRNLLLRANVVLMRETIEHFAALCEELADWGMDEITFNQLGGVDRPEFYPANRLQPDQVERLRDALPSLRERLRQRGVRLQGADGYLHRMAATSRGEQIAIADCQPGERFLFINEVGFIAPCSFTSGLCGVPVSEISSTKDLLALPQRFAASRRRQKPAPCDDCQSTQVFAKFAA